MGARVRKDRNGILLGIILIIGLWVRLHGVLNPLLDNQAWRQADTASIAYHMLGRLTELPGVWFPTLNYDGPVPQKVELEFPLLPYLLAWTWTILGWSDLWGRLWSIGFSLLTIWGVFFFGRSCFSLRAGLWSAGIYALLPLAVYYGRVVMPEPVAQCCTIWALNAVLIYRKRRERGERVQRVLLMVAGVLMALSILAKLPQLMIFPVAGVLGFWPFKGQAKRILGYTLLALIPPLIYYSWVHWGAPQASHFVSGIITGQVIEGPKLLWRELERNVREGIGMPVLVFAGVGCIQLAYLYISKLIPSRLLMGLLLWALISFVYVWVVCSRIALDYYLVPVLIPLALLAGFVLDQIKEIPGFVVGVLLLSLLWVNGIINYEPKYLWDDRYLTQAQWLEEKLPKESIFVLSDAPPMTFYYAHKAGYRLTEPEDQKAWKQLAAVRGDYLVALPHSARKPEFWLKVKSSYPEVGPGVYRLLH